MIDPSMYHFAERTSMIHLPTGRTIRCPEHLFAALSTLTIWDVTIAVDDIEEFPCSPDIGSYVDAISPSMSTATYGTDDRLLTPTPWTLADGKRRYSLTPAADFCCRVAFQGPSGELGVAKFHPSSEESLSPQTISAARTFVQADKLANIRATGLCKGLSLGARCEVLSSDDLRDSAVLAECAAHKLCDLLGDLYLLRHHPKAEVLAINPNHRLNNALLHRLCAPP
jgi:UDP-3-O-acyl-N-acetylglucosamine deacetylase